MRQGTVFSSLGEIHIRQGSVSYIGLLHNHWSLIEEGGLGWERMAVTLFSQSDRKLLNCEHIRVQRVLDLNPEK